jgi:flavin-dependent dehydrogenase
MRPFDVAVIVAGRAGATAALRLVRAGLRVALGERRRVVRTPLGPPAPAGPLQSGVGPRA